MCVCVCVCVCRDGEPVDMADFVQMYNEDSCESVRYGPFSSPPPFPINMYTHFCMKRKYVCVYCLMVEFQLQSTSSSE